tara:strand:- start:14821 stop:15432 length:612 start_codon:yes stop_codon:yes gene_type:complete
MSAKAAMARRKQRATSTAQPAQQRPPSVQQNVQQNVQSRVTSPMPQGKFNVNQFMIFLNNKIENIDNRVNTELSELKGTLNKELQELKGKDVTHNIDILEQTVETQKLKIAKLNSYINDLQSNYLVLNTSYIALKNNLKPETRDVSSETDHSELLKVDLTKVPITEEEEEEDDAEEEMQQPEPEPLITEESQENLLMDIMEKK